MFAHLQDYMTFKAPNSHDRVSFNYSLVHLKRGMFLSAGSDKKLKIWIPGKSQSPNYLGQLEEDYPVSNLQIFGSQSKKQKDDELQVIYTCGQYIKLLSFKTLTSMIVYKNLKEITAMCIVKQNTHLISFGTTSGAIKEFDMKTKKIVRSQSQRHKTAITSITSFGKFLISCSSADNLVIVYNYQSQEEHCAISLDHTDVNQGVEEDEKPCALCCFKDHVS